MKYHDAEGKQPEVEQNQYSVFASFIEGEHNHDGIDMDDIDGITCQIIHPMVTDLTRQHVELMNETGVMPEQLLTQVQRQVIACLSADIIGAINAIMPPELEKQLIILPTEDAYQFLIQAMTGILLIYEGIGTRFDDIDTLRIARKMAEYIEAETDGDLPWFWDEVENVLEGYEEADADDQ